MNFHNTNEFGSVSSAGANKNKIIISVCAVFVAVLAIAAGIMLSVIMNTNSPETPVSLPKNETTDTTASPSNETTSSPETTSGDTAIPIIPGTDTTTTEKTDTPKTPPVKVDGKFTICIDPGHGYDDPGAVSEYLGDVTESEIVMDISNYLKDILISYGYNIVMTHEDNTPPAGTYGQYLFNFKTRIAYANTNFDYDYYISVHCNSYPESYVNGTRIYYHAPSGANNSEVNTIAEYLKGGIAAALPAAKTPSLHPLDSNDAYYVTKHAESLASMLVETGFVTNPDDAAKMLDEEWKKTMAQGIADGIHAYLSSLN